jgi:broad-specificity NMP kinase
MPAYLITGSPGAGKTSIIDELARRGYAAYNTDDMPEITRFYDLRTGDRMDSGPPAPIDFSRYAWNWNIDALKKLLKSADTVFVGGITSNTLPNLGLFDRIFVPHPSLTELERRIVTRTNNDFGKHPDELADILKDHDGSDDFWRSKGAIIIHADRPIKEIADEILSHIK